MTTDQPSLEEARRQVDRAWYLYDGCVDRDEVEAAVRTLARAEVIREVEAALEELEGELSNVDEKNGVSFARLLVHDLPLRALSLGGEGEA